jgi:hypothetical protein
MSKVECRNLPAYRQGKPAGEAGLKIGAIRILGVFEIFRVFKMLKILRWTCC